MCFPPGITACPWDHRVSVSSTAHDLRARTEATATGGATAMVVVMTARSSMAPPSKDAATPSEPRRHAPSPQARRARIGTLLMFTVNGMTFASLVPRYPQIKADLDASRTSWGLAVGLGPLGGLILGLFAARLIRRHGSRTIALWPQILSTTCLLLLARAPHTTWVFVAMIVMNVFDALTDIAMDNVNSTPGLAAGSGLTVATWSRRLGFMIHPVLIGLLGDTVSLRWALVCLPAEAALILMATPAFQPVTAAPPD